MKVSQTEHALFIALGMDSLLGHIPICSVYSIAMEDMFIANSTGPAVESLRRCCKALRDGSVWRLTPEWDELIQL